MKYVIDVNGKYHSIYGCATHLCKDCIQLSKTSDDNYQTTYYRCKPYGGSRAWSVTEDPIRIGYCKGGEIEVKEGSALHFQICLTTLIYHNGDFMIQSMRQCTLEISKLDKPDIVDGCAWLVSDADRDFWFGAFSTKAIATKFTKFLKDYFQLLRGVE